ncbi:MAG: electron transfer flavoprotein subunit alpha/FixB family protein, partial [Myxococcota bacterium]
MATHLIVVEHNGGKLFKGTLNAVAAARQSGGDVHAIVLGQGTGAIATEVAKYASTVHHAEHPGLAQRLAQPYAKVVADCAKAVGATHVWAAASGAGKDILPRVAARLDAAMASDISAVVDSKTYKRPMWAGNIIGTVELTTALQVITVRPTEFPLADEQGAGNVVAFAADPGVSKMEFVGFDEVKSDRPQLGDASVIVSGGRGVKGPEGFKELVEPLADVLGAAIGASRAVCDAGWVPNDWQVGQTGKVVAPDLYIAVGISGAIQHVAGMKGSKTIVAVNKDEEAP